MSIEELRGSGAAITDPNAIDLLRLATLKAGLKLEARGLKRSGRSCLSICRAEGLVKARTSAKALVELEEFIAKRKQEYGYE